MADVVAGLLSFTMNGKKVRAKGSWSYNLGRPQRTGIAGADGMHGFKEEPQTPFIEGVVTDGKDIVLDDFLLLRDSTCTLHLRNGKVFTLSKAWYAGEGTVETEESEFAVRFEGMGGEEVRP